MPRGAQVKRDRLVITVERRGISSRIAPRHLSCPQFQVPSAKTKGEYWISDCSLRCRPQGLDSQDNLDWRYPGVPTQAFIVITPEEPRVLITAVGGGGWESISQFILNTGATFSVLTEAPGPLSSWSTAEIGLSGWAKHYVSHLLSGNWDSVLFSHEFLIMPKSPSPLLGRDILSNVQASVFMTMEPVLSLPLIEQNVNPKVWDD